MRRLLMLGLVVVGCAGTTTTRPPPRPTPAEGGFQASPRPVIDRWIALGVPAPVSEVQQTLQLGGHGGPISHLLVKGASGEPEIDQIQIEYMDRTVKGVRLQRRFVPGDGQVIELKEYRPIQKITIYIDPDSQGTVEIFGG